MTSDSQDPGAPVRTEPIEDLAPDAVRNAPLVQPRPAPVSRPQLPPEKAAGVRLTWGVLILIAVFLAGFLTMLWRSESATQGRIGLILGAALAADTVVVGSDSLPVIHRDTSEMRAVIATLDAVRAAQGEYRAFWKDVLQVVLLNVLLPVLTALLGYVFGTQAVTVPKGRPDE